MAEESIRQSMRIVQLEGEVRDHMLMNAQMRKFLAGALCAECGDPLGTDDEIVQDDDDRTLHARCEAATHEPKQGAPSPDGRD